MALADLGARFDIKALVHVAEGIEQSGATSGFDLHPRGYVLVATQGQGDKDPPRAAVSHDRRYVSLLGSPRKFETIAVELSAEDPGLDPNLAKIKIPAELEINAITPDEIALSIFVQITPLRRANLTIQIAKGSEQ